MGENLQKTFDAAFGEASSDMSVYENFVKQITERKKSH